MPRNNGIYTAPPSAWNPAVDGIPMSPADWNNFLADVSAALTQSVSKDGQTAMTGALPMGNQRIINLGAATANTDALRRAAIAKGADIASAASITIPNEGALFTITGTTGISAVAMPYDGKFAFLRFDGVLTLTNSASLLLPSGRNYTTKAGDMLLFVAIGGSNVQVFAGGAGSGFEIGDYLDTVRTPDSTWLRRNGALYESSDYPILASMLPPLSGGFQFSTFNYPFEQSGDGSIQNLCRLSDSILATGVKNINKFLVTVSFDEGKTWAIKYMDEGTNYAALSETVFDPEETIGICVTAENGYIRVSQDGGETWSRVSVKTGQIIYHAAYFAKAARFFLCGSGGFIASSQDGITWTELSSGISNEISWINVFDEYLVAAVKSPSSANKILVSADGISFSPKTVGIGGNFITKIMRFGSSYVGFYADGFIYSDNLDAWFVNFISTSFFDPSFTGSCSATNGELLFYATANRIYYSADAVSAAYSNLPPGVNAHTNGTMLIGADNNSLVLIPCISLLTQALKTSPGQFRVPDDNPGNGWIKAL